MRTAFLVLAAVLLLPACGGDDAEPSGEPGTELGPCVDGQFCLSPLQCVEQLCVNPDQLDDTGVADDGWPTTADSTSPTTADGTSPTTADAGSSTVGMSTSEGSTSGGTTATGDPTDASASDVTGDEGSDACTPPECGSYRTKMQSCYPMLDVDWYAECLNVADICHIDGPCVVPAIVTCSISSSCDAVVDGACLDGDAC